jgi:hypothetical protein
MLQSSVQERHRRNMPPPPGLVDYMRVIYKNTAPMALDGVLRIIDLGRGEDGCKICRDEGGRVKIWGAKLTWTGRKAGNKVQIVNRDGQHFCYMLNS